MKNCPTILKVLGIVGILFFPATTFATLEITEIMYAPEEGVAYEWFEVYNSGGRTVNLADWRFNDGSNHVFEAPPENGGQGSLVIGPGAYAVIAKEADMFLSIHSGYSGTVIDASFTLTDTGKTLSLINAEGSSVDSASYTENSGAQKNGLSYQKVGGIWEADTPTPGTGTASSPASSTNNEEVGENSSQSESTSTSGGSNEKNTSTQKPVFLKDDLSVSLESPSTVLAGDDVRFVSLVIDENKNEVKDAYVRWNFGDGTVDTGAESIHVYPHSGTYTVVVRARDSGLEVSDMKTVKVVEADISIGETYGSTVEIINSTDLDVDMSGWKLRGGSSEFAFPELSFLKSNSSITVTTSLPTTDSVSLLFPSGLVVARKNLPVSRSTGAVAPVVVRSKPGTEKREALSEGDTVPAQSGIVLGESETRPPQEEESKSPLAPWITALFGVIVLGIAGSYAVRKEQEESKDEETFTFIDDINA